MPTRDPDGDGPSRLWFPFRAPAAEAARARLVCLPYAGGSPTLYAGWSEPLADLVEVLPVCPPGRGHRFSEPPAGGVDELAGAVADAVVPLLDRPVALFGYSLGALVAFEVARRLEAAGRPPHLLVVAACPAPSAVDGVDTGHDLPDDTFVEMLRGLNATPDSILDNPEMVELLLPMLRTDFSLAARYRYRPAAPLHVPILTVAGRDDPQAPPPSMLGWADEGSVARHVVVDGEHLFIHSSEPDLIECLRTALAGTFAGR